jgi:hypothetical protein
VQGRTPGPHLSEGICKSFLGFDKFRDRFFVWSVEVEAVNRLYGFAESFGGMGSTVPSRTVVQGCLNELVIVVSNVFHDQRGAGGIGEKNCIDQIAATI